VALSLFAGAVLAEVFRAGIQAVPLGQIQAAKSLGLSEFRVWYSVVLPQALRLMIPAFILVIADLVKMSGLLAAIGVSELVYEASVLSGNSFRYFEFFTVIGIVYFIIIFPTSMLARRLDARFVAQRT
jgi:ABC-type amino acid transport system permease subunit